MTTALTVKEVFEKDPLSKRNTARFMKGLKSLAPEEACEASRQAAYLCYTRLSKHLLAVKNGAQQGQKVEVDPVTLEQVTVMVLKRGLGMRLGFLNATTKPKAQLSFNMMIVAADEIRKLARLGQIQVAVGYTGQLCATPAYNAQNAENKKLIIETTFNGIGEFERLRFNPRAALEYKRLTEKETPDNDKDPVTGEKKIIASKDMGNRSREHFRLPKTPYRYLTGYARSIDGVHAAGQ